MLIVGSPEAERKFRDYIGYGRTTLPVLYNEKVYQICRIDGDLVFVQIDGYKDDELDVIPGSPDRIKSYVKGRKGFRIAASSVIGITVRGQYADYVTLGGVSLHLCIKSGRRKKNMRLEVMGYINEFLLREFFKDVGNERKIIRNNANAPAYALEAILLHFNGKCGRLNCLMILIAAAASLLVAMDFLWITPYNNILTGIGALLPLVNFIIYLCHPKLIRFFAPSVQNKTKYVCRKYVGFYAKFGVPAVIGMFSAFGGRTVDADIARLFLISIGFFAAMVILMILFLQEHRYRYILFVGYAVMMLMYPAQTVHFVNRMAVTKESTVYHTTVEKYRVNPNSDVDKAEYIGIALHDGKTKELPLGLSENISVKPGETVVMVHEYSGLLGIKCADIKLNE